MHSNTFRIGDIDKVSDVDCAPALTVLVNDAYRGRSGAGRWTSEADLVLGARMTVKAMTSLIRDSNTDLYVVFENAEPIGCVSAAKVTDATIEFGCFAVAPHLHGSGLGKYLLDYVERACRENCTLFQVVVVSENNALVSFYQKRGYTLTETRKPYPLDAGVGIPLSGELDLVVLQKPSR